MSTYGDRGNVMILQNRARWRGIDVRVAEITLDSPAKEMAAADILFMGGAQDQQQEIVSVDLLKRRHLLQERIEANIPGLFICGAYQFLGMHYITAERTVIEGLKIFDLFTENPGLEAKRLVGRVVAESLLPELAGEQLVGFENHGGRTHLAPEMKPFATVVHGWGNNGEDKTEGISYKNTIGTYMHGPILAGSPRLADLILARALTVKYGEDVPLKPLGDQLEDRARQQFITTQNK